MFNLHITLLMAVTGLQDIVKRFGEDHTGNLASGGCAYVERVEGVRLIASCIVGQFFADLGILRVLVNDSGDYREGYSGINTEGTCSLPNGSGLGTAGISDESRNPLRDALRERFGITFDDEAYQFLQSAQNSQDGSNQWGDAVEAAAKHIERLRGTTVAATAVERLLKVETAKDNDGLAEWERELLAEADQQF
jgi:hypothetical protein